MEVQGDNTTETQTTAQAAEGTPKEQVSEGQQAGKQEQSVEQNDLGWTEEQKAYIKGLRDENAKYRTRAKERDSEVSSLNERLGKFETGLKTLFGEEGDDLTPEERVEALQVQNEQLAVQSALKEAAFEYGVDRDSYDYFEFLVTKRLNELEDGEELSEEDLDAIAVSAKAKNVSSTTSVGLDSKDSPTPDSGAGGISLDDFAAMGISEKSVLYQKDPALYNSLAKQEQAAKQKR